MTKKELITELALQDDFASTAAADRAVERIIEIIKEEVTAGNSVDISGLGKFFPQLQKGRTCVVPGTDRTVDTEDKTVPKFKAAAGFKAAVASK